MKVSPDVSNRNPNRLRYLIRRFQRMFNVTHVRIEDHGTLFLLVGKNRNTKDDQGAWVNSHGERLDWDYVAWTVIASGKTASELVKSANHYKRIAGMTMWQYLKELKLYDTRRSCVHRRNHLRQRSPRWRLGIRA